MGFQKRQLIEVQFRLPPNGELKEHPAVILSNSEINELEEGFVAVMMTSNNPDDEYSFPISDDMVSLPFNDKKHREIRLQLIGNFMDSDVIPNKQPLRFLKETHFKRLIIQINEITFGLDL